MREDCWILTQSNKKVHLFYPDHSEIDIYDIIWSLSNLCRFGGHTHQ